MTTPQSRLPWLKIMLVWLMAWNGWDVRHIDRIVVRRERVCVCVCVHGTCYHNYKGLILVWSLRHEPILWGGWTRTAGSRGALVQLTIHLGVRVRVVVVHLRVSLPPWPPVCQL